VRLIARVRTKAVVNKLGCRSGTGGRQSRDSRSWHKAARVRSSGAGGGPCPCPCTQSADRKRSANGGEGGLDLLLRVQHARELAQQSLRFLAHLRVGPLSSVSWVTLPPQDGSLLTDSADADRPLRIKRARKFQQALV
jgi:hypothetical protein